MQRTTSGFGATLLLLSLLGMLTAQMPKPQTLEQTLSECHWRKRVVLVAAATPTQPEFREQQALLAANRAALAERDILVVDVLYNQLSEVDKLFLKQKTGVSPAHFAVVLIGKDGGVKMKSQRPLATATLFSTIDRMPMRQQEMQRGIVDND